MIEPFLYLLPSGKVTIARVVPPLKRPWKMHPSRKQPDD